MGLSSKRCNDEFSDCFGKAIYTTKKRADDEAKWIRRKGLWGGDKYPYYCQHCNAWHLTSEKSQKKVKNGNRYNKRSY